MASNSSAAFFGIRDGDHQQQDQIKPPISPQQQLAAALPGVADYATAAPGHGAPAAAVPPPPKKKRTLPGNKSLSTPVIHAYGKHAWVEISSGSIVVL
jgi:hypothetical protein